MEEWLEKRIKEFEKKAEWLKNKKRAFQKSGISTERPNSI